MELFLEAAATSDVFEPVLAIFLYIANESKISGSRCRSPFVYCPLGHWFDPRWCVHACKQVIPATAAVSSAASRVFMVLVPCPPPLCRK